MIAKRPSLLMMMAGAAALSTLAHGVAASGPDEDAAQTRETPTRLGTAIQSEINEKKKTARERERALDLREQALKASERRLKASLQNQKDQQEKQEKPETEKDAARAGKKTDQKVDELSKLDQLARIYQSMKAKQAAPVFEQLDIDVQIAVARKMRERSTAQILAAMTPAGAARLSMALAGKPPRVRGPRSNPPR